ncbi:MAG: hypothetical protein P9X24_13240 [Candidatus Hatepunaea meridiana]|nr:hypothetical protein [Candidatus Hatepunaea meridiana]
MNKKNLTEEEIDEVVIAQIEDNSAWETPIHVHKSRSDSLSIPVELIARAAFLAKLHKETGVEEWLTRIIRERVELEETAFDKAKREMTANISE